MNTGLGSGAGRAPCAGARLRAPAGTRGRDPASGRAQPEGQAARGHPQNSWGQNSRLWGPEERHGQNREAFFL